MLAAVLVWGAVAKLIAPDDFGVVVCRLFDRRIQPPISVSLGVVLAWVEVALAPALLFDGRRRVWLVATGALVSLFILVLVRLMTMPDAPSCGCLSAPGLRAHPYEHALGIVRNIALPWVCWIAWRCLETKHDTQAIAPA